MAKAILKIEKIKSTADFNGRQFHNFGLINNARPNADSQRTHLNKILISPDNKSYFNLWKKRIKEAENEYGNMTIRKNAVRAYEIVLGFSEDNGKFNLSEEDFTKWQQDNLDFLKDTFG